FELRQLLLCFIGSIDSFALGGLHERLPGWRRFETLRLQLCEKDLCKAYTYCDEIYWREGKYRLFGEQRFEGESIPQIEGFCGRCYGPGPAVQDIRQLPR